MADAPLVEMRNVFKAFGGVHAVEDVTVHVGAGEVLGIVGHNGAGKSTLIKILSGALTMDSGSILMRGEPVAIDNPRAARSLGIETLYQNLALADNLDAAANLFLGRELTTPYGKLDNKAMAEATREVIARINPEFANLGTPVLHLSGGQRQTIAIARAVYFNARVLIMDEPTAALGLRESAAFKELVLRLKQEGHRHVHDQPRPARRLRHLGPHLRHVRRARGRHAAHRRSHQGPGPLHDHPRQAARRGIGGGPGQAALNGVPHADAGTRHDAQP